MKKNVVPVIIIGAGPIGCYLGQLLKMQGIKTVLIEEHKEIGRPIHCAGLVGKRVFEEAKLPLSLNCIINTINGAVIHLGKDKIEIKREGVAYVIDREKFDKKLGENLDTHFETKFLGLEKEDSRYIIETDKVDFEANIVVGTDGAKSLVREFVSPNKRVSFLTGVQFRMKFKTEYKDMVQVFIKKPYFYWIIPEENNIARVGVISKNPYQDLLDFIKEVKIRGKILEKFAGIVPLTYFTPLSKERIFLVGDSASQIKPLTYGGISMGMKAAEILSKCIIQKRFSQYTSIWLKRFGKEIKIGLRARQIFSQLTNEDLKNIFSFIREKREIIEKRGDFENHSSLIWEFLKHPDTSGKLYSILLKIIKASIKLPNYDSSYFKI